MNKVILSGNIGSINCNGKQTFIRIATKRLVKGDDNKTEALTTWHDVVAHGEQATNAGNALKVGDVVTFDCYLSYKEDETPRKTYINVGTFELLSRKSRKRTEAGIEA